MKHIIITALLITIPVIFSSCSSTIPDEQVIPHEKGFMYTINTDSLLNKDTIFERTLFWISQNILGYKTGIYYMDKDKGIIQVIGRASENTGYSFNEDAGSFGGYIGTYYTLTASIQSDRAEYQFQSIYPKNIYKNMPHPEIYSVVPYFRNYYAYHYKAKILFDDMMEDIKNFIKGPDC